jgi:hypothetical protein
MLHDTDRGCKTGKPVNQVFDEFERFIEEEYDIPLEPVTKNHPSLEPILMHA